MEKCKNCDTPAVCGSVLCHDCRNEAMCECKSNVTPKLRRSDGDGDLVLSQQVYRSCKGKS
jgi:hypothetical protein